MDSRTFYSNYDVIGCRRLCGGKRIYLGDAEQRKCRFCGKTRLDGASFSKTAHAFPELIGNKVLLTNYECDECNTAFSSLEDSYAKFFRSYHMLGMVIGKKKHPPGYKVKRDGEVVDQLKWEGSTLVRYRHSPDTDEGSFSDAKESYYPIDVFRLLVKMALSVMPESELPDFQETLDWLICPNRVRFHQEHHPLYIKHKFMSGTMYTEDITYWLSKLKPEKQGEGFGFPYVLFCLSYGSVFLLIEVPQKRNGVVANMHDCPFPPLNHRENDGSHTILDLSVFEVTDMQNTEKAECHFTLKFNAVPN